MARPRGFCAGVRRAITIVERALERHQATPADPLYVRHAIVHNDRVVADLASRGARFVEELDEVPDEAAVVLSAHGVPLAVEQEAQARGLTFYDATCPLVTKVHLHGARYAREGRALVLIGHSGHPEVVGTLGRMPGPVHLVASEAEVAALPLADDAPVAYITQTTLAVDDTRHIIAALEARFADLVGPATDDICYATQNRQVALRELAERCDALLVVGAPYSSNSTRLAEIGAASGRKCLQIATAAQIPAGWLDGVATLGLTAGASAPEVLVEEVLEYLGRIRQISVSELDGAEENVSFGLPAALRERARPPVAVPGARLARKE